MYATFIKFIWMIIIFITGQKFTYGFFCFEGGFEIGIFEKFRDEFCPFTNFLQYPPVLSP